VKGLRSLALSIALVGSVACVAHRGPEGPVQALPFADDSWDDGMALVSTYSGRVQRYGIWREATVRDYLVREYLDPVSFTKRDNPKGGEVAVLKANRLMEFSTGSYDYRLMGSYLFDRAEETLVHGKGVCLNACGIVVQFWDRRSQRLQSDSYWEGEGRASAPLSAGEWHFADALPFVAPRLANGSEIRVLAPLVAPRSILVPEGAVGEAAGVGFGDLCAACARPGDVGYAFANDPRTTVPGRTLRVARRGPVTELLGEDGVAVATFRVDADGHLESWTVAGEQEFRRARQFRGPYWQMTEPSDRRRVKP